MPMLPGPARRTAAWSRPGRRTSPAKRRRPSALGRASSRASGLPTSSPGPGAKRDLAARQGACRGAIGQGRERQRLALVPDEAAARIAFGRIDVPMRLAASAIRRWRAAAAARRIGRSIARIEVAPAVMRRRPGSGHWARRARPPASLRLAPGSLSHSLPERAGATPMLSHAAPSSSAAIWARPVQMPCPVSTWGTATVICPSRPISRPGPSASASPVGARLARSARGHRLQATASPAAAPVPTSRVRRESFKIAYWALSATRSILPVPSRGSASAAKMKRSGTLNEARRGSRKARRVASVRSLPSAGRITAIGTSPSRSSGAPNTAASATLSQA